MGLPGMRGREGSILGSVIWRLHKRYKAPVKAGAFILREDFFASEISRVQFERIRAAARKYLKIYRLFKKRNGFVEIENFQIRIFR